MKDPSKSIKNAYVSIKWHILALTHVTLAMEIEGLSSDENPHRIVLS